jgi:hypothetical protein
MTVPRKKAIGFHGQSFYEVLAWSVQHLTSKGRKERSTLGRIGSACARKKAVRPLRRAGRKNKRIVGRWDWACWKWLEASWGETC